MDLRIVTAILVAVVLLSWSGWARSVHRARLRMRALDSAKRGQSTRYGQITEQFAPFMADWPWDPKGFRFLGTPVDGVQFTPEGVVFVEIKAAGSRLSPLQREIRDHIAAGRVAWQEVRVR